MEVYLIYIDILIIATKKSITTATIINNNDDNAEDDFIYLCQRGKDAANSLLL